MWLLAAATALKRIQGGCACVFRNAVAVCILQRVQCLEGGCGSRDDCSAHATSKNPSTNTMQRVAQPPGGSPTPPRRRTSHPPRPLAAPTSSAASAAALHRASHDGNRRALRINKVEEKKGFAPAASAPPTWPFSATNDAMTMTSMKEMAATIRRSMPLRERGEASVAAGDAGEDCEE
jgi:hypothetical protein